MSRIVLASGSPRRQELLNRIGITDFDIRVPQTDEHYPAGLTPAQIVEYISREKADAAAKLCTPEEIVITADTMAGPPPHCLHRRHRPSGRPCTDGKRSHRRYLPPR